MVVHDAFLNTLTMGTAFFLPSYAGSAEHAGVENAGTITHGKLPEEQNIRYQ